MGTSSLLPPVKKNSWNRVFPGRPVSHRVLAVKGFIAESKGIASSMTTWHHENLKGWELGAYLHTPLKTNMTRENPPFSLGDTSSKCIFGGPT